MELSRRNFLFCAAASAAVWKASPAVERLNIQKYKVVATYIFDTETMTFTKLSGD